MRPVTHTADVAVKSAVSSGAPPGPAREIGNINRAVPTKMAAKNASGTSRAGCLIPPSGKAATFRADSAAIHYRDRFQNRLRKHPTKQPRYRNHCISARFDHGVLIVRTVEDDLNASVSCNSSSPSNSYGCLAISDAYDYFRGDTGAPCPKPTACGGISFDNSVSELSSVPRTLVVDFDNRNVGPFSALFDRARRHGCADGSEAADHKGFDR